MLRIYLISHNFFHGLRDLKNIEMLNSIQGCPSVGGCVPLKVVFRRGVSSISYYFQKFVILRVSIIWKLCLKHPKYVYFYGSACIIICMCYYYLLFYLNLLCYDNLLSYNSIACHDNLLLNDSIQCSDNLLWYEDLTTLVCNWRCLQHKIITSVMIDRVWEIF